MLEDGYDNLEIYKELTGHNSVQDHAVYALIHTIQKGKRHVEIRSKYNISSESNSKTRKKFTEEEVNILKARIRDGVPTTEIVKEFGGRTTKDKVGKRVFDKLQYLKKELRSEVSSTTIES